MSRLLIEERPLVVLPSLAKLIGLNQAIVLQQIYWALGRKSVIEIEGVRWLKADLSWFEAQFPFWSEATIRRTLKDLTARDLVKSQRGAESNVYTINRAALGALTTGQSATATGQSDRSSRERVELGLKEDEREQQATEAAAGDGQLFAVPPTEVPGDDKSSEAAEVEARIKVVWDHYFGYYGDKLRIKTLTDSRRKCIKSALKIVSDEEDVLLKAIDGFVRYRQVKKGGTSIEDIFSSRPGGSSLTELIEFWISQADDSPTMASTVPPILRERVNRRRLAVVESLQRPDDERKRREAHEAVEWLRVHAKERPVIEDNKVVRWERLS